VGECCNNMDREDLSKEKYVVSRLRLYLVWGCATVSVRIKGQPAYLEKWPANVNHPTPRQ